MVYELYRLLPIVSPAVDEPVQVEVESSTCEAHRNGRAAAADHLEGFKN